MFEKVILLASMIFFPWLPAILTLDHSSFKTLLYTESIIPFFKTILITVFIFFIPLIKTSLHSRPSKLLNQVAYLPKCYFNTSETLTTLNLLSLCSNLSNEICSPCLRHCIFPPPFCQSFWSQRRHSWIS